MVDIFFILKNIEDEPLMFFSSVDEIEMVGLSYEGEKNEENLY